MKSLQETISFYEQAMREEAEFQRANGTLQAWCKQLRLNPAIFEKTDD